MSMFGTLSVGAHTLFPFPCAKDFAGAGFDTIMEQETVLCGAGCYVSLEAWACCENVAKGKQTFNKVPSFRLPT